MRRLLTGALLALALPAAAQPPRLENARLTVEAAPQGDPRGALTRPAPAPRWVAWEVPSGDRESHRCCFGHLKGASADDFCCGGCDLESDHSFTSGRSKGHSLEGHGAVHVFLRVTRGGVERVRTFSPDCALDAGGVAVLWLTGVAPERSLAALEALVEARVVRDVKEGALIALAAHEGGAPPLVRLARRHADAEVRGQALFWLAQVAGEKAVKAIGDAVEHDPDTDVKVQAVFALTQLPADEGIPHLLRLARTHRNREVRRQSIFWLGQSRDERALDFLEELVLR